MKLSDVETKACTPTPLNPDGLTRYAILPHDLKPKHIGRAMNDFLDFLGFINQALGTKKIQRLESFLMPANFSSIVGEFMTATIPKHCKTLVKNNYHNGHPDLVPAGIYSKDACLHGDKGIEVKASHHLSGWQGHNAEDVGCWCLYLNVTAHGMSLAISPRSPSNFLRSLGAQITKADWQFSGRSPTSRRTITASVKRSGFEKMEANWIYRLSGSAEKRK